MNEAPTFGVKDRTRVCTKQMQLNSVSFNSLKCHKPFT